MSHHDLDVVERHAIDIRILGDASKGAIDCRLLILGL
jgi:hypothetical protein